MIEKCGLNGILMLIL